MELLLGGTIIYYCRRLFSRATVFSIPQQSYKSYLVRIFSMIIFYYSQSAVKFSKLVWTRESRDLLLSHPKREFMHELIKSQNFFYKNINGFEDGM